MSRAWVLNAIAEIAADFQRSSDTHMIRLPIPCVEGIQVYLKDESTHPTGSLKHRLARSLFLYALCNGWIDEGTPIIEASSGSTAVSEAYFAQLLCLPFVAVVPESTTRKKIEQIEFYGGTCHFVKDPSRVVAESRRLADECGGHFMDQFTFAERATDWRGNNNIAESLFRQMELEPFACPAWIVVGAGTGGTSATLGRYIRYFQKQTNLCVVDPEHSVFFDYYDSKNCDLFCTRGSRIEGIGRQRPEPSFIPSLVDAMFQVPDELSVAAMLHLEKVLGRRCGASTGTNVIGVIEIICRMRQADAVGSIVTLLCDSGERYHDTYFSETWRQQNGMDVGQAEELVAGFFETGQWPGSLVRHCFRGEL